ncbi:MAG: hypothetical protein ABID38_04365 [Candidatus Diapherotrites archaeon]
MDWLNFAKENDSYIWVPKMKSGSGSRFAARKINLTNSSTLAAIIR